MAKTAIIQIMYGLFIFFISNNMSANLRKIAERASFPLLIFVGKFASVISDTNGYHSI